MKLVSSGVAGSSSRSKGDGLDTGSGDRITSDRLAGDHAASSVVSSEPQRSALVVSLVWRSHAVVRLVTPSVYLRSAGNTPGMPLAMTSLITRSPQPSTTLGPS